MIISGWPVLIILSIGASVYWHQKRGRESENLEHMIKKNYVVQERKKKNSNYNESGNEMKVERSSQHVCMCTWYGKSPYGERWWHEWNKKLHQRIHKCTQLKCYFLFYIENCIELKEREREKK